MQGWLKKHFWPIAILILIAILIFWPILQEMNSRVAGEISAVRAMNAKDAYQNIWNFWWARKTCFGFCGNLWQTEYLFYPQGTSLLFQTWAYPTLFLIGPIMFLSVSPVIAYNIGLILGVTVSFLGCYILIYYLTKNTFAGFLGALIYGLSPFVIGHILDGQLNLVNVGYFPIFLLFILLANEKKKLIYQFLAAFSLLIIGLNDYIFLIFAVIIWGVYLIFKKITEKADIFELVNINGLILMAFLVPFILFNSKQIANIKNFNLNGETKWNAEYSSANLKSYNVPPNYTLIGHKFFKESYQEYSGIYSDKTLYLGLVPVALVALGIWSERKSKRSWYILIIGVVGLLFSLGPNLKIGAKNFVTWMPFDAMSSLPLFNIIRAPSRFSILVFLSLAIFAGFGVVLLLEKIKNKKLFLITPVLLTLAILLEYFPFRMPFTPIYTPDGYQEIMKDKDDFAIIEAPPLWMSGLGDQSRYSPIETLYYQTVHEKKIANGYVTRATKEAEESYAEIPILRFLVNQTNNPGQSQDSEAILERYENNYLENITADNPYKYLVVNKNPAWSDYTLRIEDILTDRIESIYEDYDVEIYKFK